MILDIRERELIVRLPTWQTKQLAVGDIWIGVSGEHISPGGVVAERKSADDLEASILDGRYREQRARLLAYCAEKEARPLYIIEGDLDRLHGRLTKQALLKYLSRLTLRYGVSVLQTGSLNETADLARILSDQWKEDPSVFQGETVKYADTISSSRKTNRIDNCGLAMLQQCPGISAKGAQALMEHFHTFHGVLQGSVNDIANIKVGNRKLGPVVAERLWHILHDHI